MTTFTSQTKSQLAKLLATENIRIEHRKMNTAAFDPKNRVLYCPIWKDMSGDLYDLLMGHEVGHALYTPAQGWHDAVCDNGKNFKAFLNVIEDARIEKKIKRKYPGLRPSFVRAYKTLMDQDFFGIGNKDINDLSFINRLNLYTKSDYTLSVTFGAEEKDLVDRVRACETWDDVIKITGEVWDYSKKEQEEQFNFNYDSPMDDAEFSEGQEFDDGESFGDDYDESENVEGKGSAEGDTDDDGDDDFDEEGNEINRFKDSSPCESFDEPVCETDNNFRNRESDLLDEKSKDYLYLTLPKPVMKQIVTPAKRVHEQIEQDRNSRFSDAQKCKLESLIQEFKKRNEKYVSLLVKEFEMKKAASRFAKAKVANTGDIDVSRIYKYQVDDNIFRKVMRVPKGKSHGLVLLLDRSGSMNDNMAGSIEQILVLTSFCRKVNIPFVVYGFGDQVLVRNTCDFPNEFSPNAKDRITERIACFSTNPKELQMGTVFLREYMNSKMSNSEYTKVLRNMVQLMNSYGTDRLFSASMSESLSNTPMNQAMIALANLTNEFRKVNNLDIVNTVLIHDGDSDFCNYYYNPTIEKSWHVSGISYQYTNVFIVDKSTKKEYQVKRAEDIQPQIMNWYSDKTGSKIFGFFVSTSNRSAIPNMIRDHYVDEKGNDLNNRSIYKDWESSKEKVNLLVKEFKKEKLLISYKPGYNKFFLISGGKDLKIEDEDFTVEGKVTASKLANAFLKHNQKRQVSRVLVSKFIDGIAV
jgi:hypothetical protein